MNPNPFSDTLTFLLQPGWATAIFWLLGIASIGIAANSRHAIPGQRTLAHLGNWGNSSVNRLHVVAAEPLEIAALLHRPAARTVRDDRSRLLDGAYGQARRDPAVGRFRQ